MTWGELFGMPRTAMPETCAAFAEWWPDQLTGETVCLTDAARTVGLKIGLRMPAPAPLQPAMRRAGLLIVGSLPPAVRQAYGIRWGVVDAAAFDAAARASFEAAGR